METTDEEKHRVHLLLDSLDDFAVTKFWKVIDALNLERQLVGTDTFPVPYEKFERTKSNPNDTKSILLNLHKRRFILVTKKIGEQLVSQTSATDAPKGGSIHLTLDEDPDMLRSSDTEVQLKRPIFDELYTKIKELVHPGASKQRGMDFTYYNAIDLKRELSVALTVLNNIPYIDENKIRIRFSEFFGEQFGGLNAHEFLDKVDKILTRFQRMGFMYHYEKGESAMLKTIAVFTLKPEKLETYKERLDEELKKREAPGIINSSNSDGGKSIQPPTSDEQKYDVDLGTREIIWNGTRGKWKTHHKKESPKALKLAEFIFNEYLKQHRGGRVDEKDEEKMFSRVFGTRTVESKTLYNVFNNMRGKLDHMFKGCTPTPNAVLCWENKSIVIHL